MITSAFSRRARLNCQSVDPLPRQIAKRLIHHPLTVDPGLAHKDSAFDLHGEVRFARSIITTMAAMLGTIVGDDEHSGREGCGEQCFHFDLVGAFCHASVFPYPVIFAKEFR
jgi:hypothetical protein